MTHRLLRAALEAIEDEVEWHAQQRYAKEATIQLYPAQREPGIVVNVRLEAELSDWNVLEFGPEQIIAAVLSQDLGLDGWQEIVTGLRQLADAIEARKTGRAA